MPPSIVTHNAARTPRGGSPRPSLAVLSFLLDWGLRTLTLQTANGNHYGEGPFPRLAVADVRPQDVRIQRRLEVLAALVGRRLLLLFSVCHGCFSFFRPCAGPR